MMSRITLNLRKNMERPDNCSVVLLTNASVVNIGPLREPSTLQSCDTGLRPTSWEPLRPGRRLSSARELEECVLDITVQEDDRHTGRTEDWQGEN